MSATMRRRGTVSVGTDVQGGLQHTGGDGFKASRDVASELILSLKHAFGPLDWEVHHRVLAGLHVQRLGEAAVF